MNELNKMAAGTAKCVSCARPRKGSPSPDGGTRVEGTDGHMYLTRHPATGYTRTTELPRGGGKSAVDAARSRTRPQSAPRAARTSPSLTEQQGLAVVGGQASWALLPSASGQSR